MADAGAELARDVVSCPGADTCNLAVTQSRGLAADIGEALEEAGLAEVGGVRINISGLHQLVRAAPHRRHRVPRPRAPGPRPRRSRLPDAAGRARRPTCRSRSARRRRSSRPKRASEAVVRVVEQFAGERDAGETFSSWLERAGGASAVGKTLTDLDEFPDPRGSARLLRRLRRDRSLRRRGRRLRVRDVTVAETSGGGARPRRSRRAVSAELEQEPASSAVKWAWELFGTGAVLAASFQDCVLIDVAMQVVPEMEIVFLDTQYHFAETLWYVEQVRERVRPQPARGLAADRAGRPLAASTPTSAARCARWSRWRVRSQGKSAWLTGLRRDEAPDAGRRPHRRLRRRAGGS